MGCPDENTLAEYVDDVLDGAARRAVEQHIGTCTACRTVISDLARMQHAGDATAYDHTVEASRGPPLRGSATTIDAVRQRKRTAHIVPGTLIGEYEVKSVLGAGGMGIVFAAIHPRIGKKAAIKILQRDLAADKTVLVRFENEARAVNAIGHPNIVDIFGFGELPNGDPYYVMEHVEGTTLHDWIEAHGPVALDRAMPILRQICDALAAAHERGIVHRDLKPGNIMVTGADDAPRIKVLDFGLAKMARDADSDELTRPGAVMGTPAFMSPEQFMGQQVDQRSDVYALGVVVYQMLTGAYPFQGETPSALGEQHLHHVPRMPSQIVDLPARVDAIIDRALAKDVGKRYATVGELRRDLERCLAETPAHDTIGELATVAAKDEAPSRRSMSSIVFQPETLVSNRYRIQRLVGQGGMGDVYEATDLELRTVVALKTVRGTATGARAERLRREIFLARKVTHPNVCRVFDIGRHAQGNEEVLFITMELLGGVTLADRLREVHKLAPADAFALFLQVASAIDAVHRVGVVHRDLKPGNVMLVPGDAGGELAKVTDFGVAHADGDPFADLSATGDIVGSPAYMAPEQVEGLEPTARTDIYALGILFYEMLTGVRPFHGETSLAAAVKRLKEDPQPPSEYLPEISPVWELAIMRSLRRAPAERFQSVDDFVSALKLDRPAGAPPKPAVSGIPKWVYPAAGLMIVVAISAVLLKSFRGEPSAPTTIALSPLTDLGLAPDRAYLADGLTQELLVRLRRIPGVTSSLAMKNAAEDSVTLARKLGVSKVVEGSITQAGDHLQIVARLVDTGTGQQLWTQSYERQVSDLFATEDDIAGAVAHALAIELPPAVSVPGELTSNGEAHELVLRARSLLARDYNRADLEQTRQALERAVELDPSYAAAIANLAMTVYWVRDFESAPDERARLLRRVLELADRALAAGPKVAEVHAARGFVFFNTTWDWAAARAELERALALDPNDHETLRVYGELLALLGQSDKALDALRRAVAADPLSARAWSHLAYQQIAVGERAEARVSLAKALELDPRSNVAHLSLGELELLEGHVDAALAQTRLIQVDGFAKMLVAMAEHTRGNDAKSAEVLADLLKTERHSAPYQIAEVYAWRGETDRAFEWLDNAFADHDGGLADVRSDPLLGSVRLDPRYRALLTKLGL